MSIPQALLVALENAKGFNRSTFEEVHASGEQITSIRLNLAKKANVHFSLIGEPIPWCPEGHYLSQRPSFTFDPLLHAGAYYVQEASSMILWHVLEEMIGQDTHKKVLDLCAAPGGKSTLLSSYFSEGLVVCNEVIKSRASVLIENISKWGSDNVIVTNNDPSHFQSLGGYFDVLVIDAPCSGSGLFRKDPESILEWSKGNVLHCSQRQQRILVDTLSALKENGLLIYSTCSYSPEEDEEIADWLIGEMQLKSRRIPLPKEWGIVESMSTKHHGYGYRFYPDQVKGEGFYIAVFQKGTNSDSSRLLEQKLALPSQKEVDMVNSFLPLPEHFFLFKQAEAIRTIHKKWFKDLQVLAKYLYIRKAGVEMVTIKGKDVIPSHELSVSLMPKREIMQIALTEEQALGYLRRKEILIEEASLGWALVTFGGLPLGWVKVLPNRVNNYYPAAWRILK